MYYVSQDVNLLQAKIEAASIRTGETQHDALILLKVMAKMDADNEEEISINGKLYDITEKKIIQDSVYYYGIEDKKEQETINNVTDHFGSENSMLCQKSLQIKGQKINTSRAEDLFKFTNSRLSIQPILTSSISCKVLVKYCDGFLTIIIPPPQA